MARYRQWIQCFGLISAFNLTPAVTAAKSTPYLLTRYIAKEYCSCRFVVQQTPKVCKNENKATNLLFRVDENKKEQVITVTNLFTKAKARFISNSHGCLLWEDDT